MTAPLDGAHVNNQLDAGLSRVALLSASCRAVLAAEIAQVRSSWWDRLSLELGEAKQLVIGWRQSGVDHFGSEVIDAVGNGAEAFGGARVPVETLFDSLDRRFDPADKERLVAQFRALEQPVVAIATTIGSYLGKLEAFERAMGSVQEKMEATVGEVQATEAQIQAEIGAINAQMGQLGSQVQAGREAVARARDEQTAGIFETIFGIVFAPVTAGLSLIIAGIGVASIVEAEAAVNRIEGQISGYQQKIVDEQSTMTADQQIVATLQSLTLSTNFVLHDLANIQTALDALRTTWIAFEGELAGTIAKLEKAQDSASLTVSRVWYAAACSEWQDIANHVAEISDLSIETEHREIA